MPPGDVTRRFNFNTNSIRVVTIEDQPWFFGSDVIRVLYGTTDGKGNLYRKLSEGEQRKVNRIHLGLTGGKPMILVSESGLYKLIMRSDNPQARAFQDWVTREVLPSIRKTGAYVTGQPSIVENPNMDPLALLMAQAQLLPKMIEQMQTQRAKIQQQAPSRTPEPLPPGKP